MYNEGLSLETMVIKTEGPMYEVLNFYKEKIKSSNILKELALSGGHYFLVSAHREENIVRCEF